MVKSGVSGSGGMDDGKSVGTVAIDVTDNVLIVSIFMDNFNIG